MQIFSFAFFCLTAAVFCLIFFGNKLLTKNSQKVHYTKWVLLLASYLFVCYADYRFFLVLGALTLIVWLCGKNLRYIKYGVLAAVLSLAFFKYTNFFAASFSRLLGEDDFTALNIIMPLGVSFYTFSAISYLVDIHRGKLQPMPLLDVALYLAFFPKLTSGPIQRGDTFFEQLNRPRSLGWNSFSEGIQIFCFGLFKKIVLADRLSVLVNQVYQTPLAFDAVTVWLAVLAYSLQIYFDFSGYSDMAIGAAKILDIHMPRNFNLPYLAHNVTELWKRWHISLSSWLQEYLYISLGGNRKGKIRAYVNLFATMVIGGLWHGASWTFIVWGALHGGALVVHKLWMLLTKSNEKHHNWLSNLLSISVTFLFTSFCWIFFRAESVNKAFQILGRLFCFGDGVVHLYLWLFIALGGLLVGSIVAAIGAKDGVLPQNRQNQSLVDGYYPILNLSKFWPLVLFFVICGLIICLAYTGGSPFIYGAF
ncbi:MAG: MBOAT family protein [Oscillospiraceae bacterium]|nr:MBOAT family protein [Oscillospiraceae bacterium]